MFSIFPKSESSDDKAREARIEAIREKQKRREEALLAKYPDIVKEEAESNSMTAKQPR